MSTLPSDVRLDTLHKIGVRLDDALEGTRLETSKREGAHAAYVNAARNVAALVRAAESDAALSPAQKEVVSHWIRRAVAVCNDLGSQANNLVHLSRGAETQTRNFVAMMKSLHDAEAAKKRTEAEAARLLAPAPVVAPVVPKRRLSLKDERLAVLEAQKAETGAQSTVEAKPARKRSRKSK
jgi:hypothetical protein